MAVTTICKNISELTISAQKACGLFMAECGKTGLKLLITETYRSQERQNYLYEQGRTRDGNIVTWTKKSRHTSRRAWDICKNVKGQEFNDKDFFAACGEIAKNLGITWGGTWKQADTPHFEIDENWTPPKEEDIDMEELERLKNENEFLKQALNSVADRVTKLEKPMVYNYIDDNMPQWARATVQKLLDKGTLQGNEKGELGLTDDMLKVFAIFDRQGIFN